MTWVPGSKGVGNCHIDDHTQIVEVLGHVVVPSAGIDVRMKPEVKKSKPAKTKPIKVKLPSGKTVQALSVTE